MRRDTNLHFNQPMRVTRSQASYVVWAALCFLFAVVLLDVAFETAMHSTASPAESRSARHCLSALSRALQRRSPTRLVSVLAVIRRDTRWRQLIGLTGTLAADLGALAV